MFKKCLVLVVVVSMYNLAFTQNPLPDFLVEKNNKGENVIAWRNPFSASLSQLVIQRSADSVKNFKSIYNVENPTLLNGKYTELPGGKFYYKIFYMLQNGAYYSTVAKTVASGYETPGILSYLNAYDTVNVSLGGRYVQYNKAAFLQLKDSVLNNTADSLKYVSGNMVNYVYYAPVYRAQAGSVSGYKFISNYLFLNNEGSPVIKLPPNDYYHYAMIIYDRDGRTELFKINHFESNELILSKASFLYPGLYPYELKYNNQLRDKNSIEIR